MSKFGLRDYFDVAFSSCYVGLRKPEPAIYQRALDILGRPRERVLFIDDREENAAGAEAAGMKAIRFEGADRLRRDLEYSTFFKDSEGRETMQLGLIGLGKMGGNMAERLRLGGHQVIGFDFNAEAVQKLTASGNVGVSSLEEMAKKFTGRKAIWIMVPQGKPVDDTIAKLEPLLTKATSSSTAATRITRIRSATTRK